MTKEQRRTIFAFIIGAIIYFFVPASFGLTEDGEKLLAVFIPTVYMWLAVGGSWPSLISVGMVTLLGVIPGASAFNAFWGNIYVAVFIPFFMMAQVLEDSGAIAYIVKWMISRKFVHGRPKLFTLMFTLAIIFVSLFSFPLAAGVLFFKILSQLSEQIGYTRDDEFFRAHGLLIGWLGQTVDGCLIWGRAFIISMVGVIAGLGFPGFTVNSFMTIGLLYLLFITIFALIIVFFWIRPDSTKMIAYDDEAIREELKREPMSKQAKYALIGMGACLLMYLVSSMSIFEPASGYLTACSIAMPVTLVCGILCFVHADGKPVMDLGAIAPKMPWGSVIFLGCVMFYASIIGGEQFGVVAFLSNILGPVVTSIPTQLAILVGFVFAAVITSIGSNAVACIVTSASFMPAFLAAGMEPARVLAFGACLIAICASAFATKSACATMSQVYCEAGIEYTGTFKYSAALLLVMILVCAFVIMPIASGVLAAVV